MKRKETRRQERHRIEEERREAWLRDPENRNKSAGDFSGCVYLVIICVFIGLIADSCTERGLVFWFKTAFNLW